MSPLVRRLLPTSGGNDDHDAMDPAAVNPAALLDELDPGSRAPDGRPHLALNMVGSLDGGATLEGRSAGLSSDTDRVLFHGLRRRYDAVMAGASTITAERYGPIVPGASTQPLAVIASASLELDPELPLLSDPGSRIVVLTRSGGELAPCRATVSYVRGSSFASMLGRLREQHGVRSVLCEGGPTLNGLLLAEGVVDELFLSLAPLLLGQREGLRIVAGQLSEVQQLELLWLLESESHLHARYAVVPGVSSATTSSSSLAS
ncbi:MAG: RibD family protein [Solirubrobacteraceae bacterium]